MDAKAMDEAGSVEWIKEVDVERKHLEGLLKDRINFHIVFASIFITSLSEIQKSGMKIAALGIVTAVSMLIALAVLRTHLLVEEALKEIKNGSAHPYKQYHNKVWFRCDANTLLVFVPFLISGFFLVVLCMSLWSCLCSH